MKKIPNDKEIKKQAIEIAKVKKLAKGLFAIIKDEKTIFETESILGFFSGMVETELNSKREQVKISDISFNYPKDKNTKVIVAKIKQIVELFAKENAADSSRLATDLSNAIRNITNERAAKLEMSSIIEKDLFI